MARIRSIVIAAVAGALAGCASQGDSRSGIAVRSGPDGVGPGGLAGIEPPRLVTGLGAGDSLGMAVYMNDRAIAARNSRNAEPSTEVVEASPRGRGH